jgi:hypothetical protein
MCPTDDIIASFFSSGIQAGITPAPALPLGFNLFVRLPFSSRFRTTGAAVYAVHV